MMNVDINLLGVLLGAVASMAVGSIWYAKGVFGAKWQKLVKLSDADLKQGAVQSMVGAFVLSLLTAYVLAHVIELSHSFYGYSYIQTGLTTGFWLWLGISMTTIMVNALFEKRNRQLSWMYAGNQLVTLLAMGLVYGWLR